MKKGVHTLKTRLLESGGTTSGAFGTLGSIHNVCHSICLGIVSFFALFGITMNILPLMFLQTYQMYFWWAALILTAVSFYFYLEQRRKRAFDRNLLLINYGMLTFALPISSGPLFDYLDIFRFLGISLALSGLFLLIFGKKFRRVYRENLQSADTESVLEVNQPQGSSLTAISTFKFPKLTIQTALFAIVISGFLTNQYLIYHMGLMNKADSGVVSTAKSVASTISNMKLTPFDVVLAKERMDKNNDGICDICGMSIDQCISSGQIDCNMGNNPQAIGVLGTQHIHADFKVYVNGQVLDFAKPEYYMKSSFIHVDSSQNKDDASGVIHMHAKNVPFGIFFRSIGMNLTKDSLTLTDGQVLKNENGNSLKFYLDGKKVDDLASYVFQPLDKLLISFGPDNDPNINQQLSSVTNFAKDH